ncbi:hypothetical protein [uncultured Eudoraea sp.]|uniref:hypothetical protein n=1 Tax=uncultured Eudoraea sp. TaxID=1035614 RepID=UPI00261A35C5|nr:hypothetical protein [uncultured Eudoraea sp.]
MNEDRKIEELFKTLQGSFDTEEPGEGHEERFLQKLSNSKGVVRLAPKKNNWWRPLSIAASIMLLFAVGASLYTSRPSIEEQVAKISPEVSQTQFYFANLIEGQINDLVNESTPETKKLVDDTLLQLNKLEINYKKLEQDLINGGNSKLILSAMITNFQTRIDLLQEVMDKIENIKTFKNYDDENITI